MRNLSLILILSSALFLGQSGQALTLKYETCVAVLGAISPQLYSSDLQRQEVQLTYLNFKDFRYNIMKDRDGNSVSYDAIDGESGPGGFRRRKIAARIRALELAKENSTSRDAVAIHLEGDEEIKAFYDRVAELKNNTAAQRIHVFQRYYGLAIDGLLTASASTVLTMGGARLAVWLMDRSPFAYLLYMAVLPGLTQLILVGPALAVTLNTPAKVSYAWQDQNERIGGKLAKLSENSWAFSGRNFKIGKDFPATMRSESTLDAGLGAEPFIQLQNFPWAKHTFTEVGVDQLLRRTIDSDGLMKTTLDIFVRFNLDRKMAPERQTKRQDVGGQSFSLSEQ